MESIIIEHGEYMLYMGDVGSFVAHKRPEGLVNIEYIAFTRDRSSAALVAVLAQNAASLFARITGRRDVPFALVDCNDPFDVAEFERQLRNRDYRTRSTVPLAVHCMEGGDGDA